MYRPVSILCQNTEYQRSLREKYCIRKLEDKFVHNEIFLPPHFIQNNLQNYYGQFMEYIIKVIYVKLVGYKFVDMKVEQVCYLKEFKIKELKEFREKLEYDYKKVVQVVSSEPESIFKHQNAIFTLSCAHSVYYDIESVNIFKLIQKTHNKRKNKLNPFPYQLNDEHNEQLQHISWDDFQKVYSFCKEDIKRHGNSPKMFLNPLFSDDMYVKGECDMIINSELYEIKTCSSEKRLQTLTQLSLYNYISEEEITQWTVYNPRLGILVRYEVLFFDRNVYGQQLENLLEDNEEEMSSSMTEEISSQYSSDSEMGDINA